jgi:hypothetical protein
LHVQLVITPSPQSDCLSCRFWGNWLCFARLPRGNPACPREIGFVWRVGPRRQPHLRPRPRTPLAPAAPGIGFVSHVGTSAKLALFVQRSSNRLLTTDYRLLPFGRIGCAAHRSDPPDRRSCLDSLSDSPFDSDSAMIVN